MVGTFGNECAVIDCDLDVAVGFRTAVCAHECSAVDDDFVAEFVLSTAVEVAAVGAVACECTTVDDSCLAANVCIVEIEGVCAGTYALNLNYANVGGKTTVINGGTFTSNGTYGGNFYSSTQNKFRNEVIINGGTFMGANGGAKADGNIEITINNGTFITEGAYHAFYLGAESFGADLATAIINGGDFYSLNGCAIGANTRSSLTVNGAFVNRTNGFTPAEGHTVVAADKTITVGGKDYTLTYQVK